MKLYIKQKVFSWRDKFTVKDEAGNDRYFVEGELFSWGKKLHVTDLGGNEVAFIQQKVFSFLPRYFVYVGGEEIAEKIRAAVKEELGLTVSIGVSFNKVFAKLASELKKPDAVTVISKACRMVATLMLRKNSTT